MNADPHWNRDPEDPELRREHWRIMEKPEDECDSRERAYKKSYTHTRTMTREDYE